MTNPIQDGVVFRRLRPVVVLLPVVLALLAALPRRLETVESPSALAFAAVVLVVRARVVLVVLVGAVSVARLVLSGNPFKAAVADSVLSPSADSSLDLLPRRVVVLVLVVCPFVARRRPEGT